MSDFNIQLANLLEQLENLIENSTEPERAWAYLAMENEHAADAVSAYYFTDYICYQVSHEGVSFSDLAIRLRELT